MTTTPLSTHQTGFLMLSERISIIPLLKFPSAFKRAGVFRKEQVPASAPPRQIPERASHLPNNGRLTFGSMEENCEWLEIPVLCLLKLSWRMHISVTLFRLHCQPVEVQVLSANEEVPQIPVVLRRALPLVVPHQLSLRRAAGPKLK